MRKFIVDFDPTFYRGIAAREGAWRHQQSLTVPAFEGGAIEVGRGQLLRISQPDGPQICDFNAFSAADPKEYFWSGRTRIIENAHLTTHNRLWSMKVRPMFTIIADTVDHKPLPMGARSHDLVFARCSREIWEVVDGKTDEPNCQDNICGAIEPFGIAEDCIHDAFNMFMTSGIDPSDNQLFYDDCDSRQGDYVDMYAEMDCIVAISACSAGDGAIPPTVRALQADTFDVPTP